MAKTMPKGAVITTRLATIIPEPQYDLYPTIECCKLTSKLDKFKNNIINKNKMLKAKPIPKINEPLQSFDRSRQSMHKDSSSKAIQKRSQTSSPSMKASKVMIN